MSLYKYKDFFNFQIWIYNVGHLVQHICLHHRICLIDYARYRGGDVSDVCVRVTGVDQSRARMDARQAIRGWLIVWTQVLVVDMSKSAFLVSTR